MNKNITIVIADDHPILLKGLKDQLEYLGYSVLKALPNGGLAYDAIQELKPDLAILDIQMPEMTGIQVATEAKKRGMQTAFILLSFYQEPEIVEQAKALGVEGYVTKEDTAAELKNCIRVVLEGGTYFSDRIKQKQEADNTDPVQLLLNKLSPSEYKILRLIAQGNSNQDIAQLLFVSERTVEKHRSNMIAKLELPKQTHALSNWTLNHKDKILGFKL
ncbi:MAG: response regulator transcription factor [Saprospiraceae bacterium]|nr:response regulator transcription factor [Saprospiraceae bacterium]